MPSGPIQIKGKALQGSRPKSHLPVQHRPAAIRRQASHGTAGINHMRVSDGFQDGPIGRTVRIRMGLIQANGLYFGPYFQQAAFGRSVRVRRDQAAGPSSVFLLQSRPDDGIDSEIILMVNDTAGS